MRELDREKETARERESTGGREGNREIERERGKSRLP